MLLKRIIILAAGVLLCIVAFVLYTEVSHARMEGYFRAQRAHYHVDELTLISSTSTGDTTPTPATPAADTNAPAPAPETTSPGAETNAPGSDTNAPGTPAPAANPFEMLPSPTPAAPADSSTPPSPSSDSNAAPATPSSTRLYSPAGGTGIASVFRFASYRAASMAPFASAVAIGQTTPAPAAPMPEQPQAAPASGEASVIVLLYHQFVPAGVVVSPKLQWTLNEDVFESEMKYIHDNGYHVVPLSDVLAFIRHEKTLLPGSVCITIDDGFKSAIVYAAPILKKYGYPWTFFIYPAFITVAEGKGAASWNDLLELQNEGIDIESHSMTHPQLTHKGTKTPEEYAAWLDNETAGAKKILEEHMGRPITCFAYPFGAYNKQVEAATIAAGYKAILTVADNPVHSTTSPYSIGRYTITRNVVKNFPAYLRQSALSLTKAEPGPGATISDPQPVITAVLTQMSADALDPASLETSVRDMGVVKHDFDPATNTVRLYLPRPLVGSPVLVNLRVKDAKTGQIMVANWHFNYEPGAGAPSHEPIPAVTPVHAKINVPLTNSAAEAETLDKAAGDTPVAKPAAPAPPPRD